MNTIAFVFVVFSVLSTGNTKYLGTIFACNHELALFLGGKDTTKFCNAQMKCVVWKPGATLIMPKTNCLMEGLNELIATKYKEKEPTMFWLGGNQNYQDKAWTWVDGTKFVDSHTFWNSGEPNGGGYEKCLEWYSGHGKWNDVSCTRKFGYVCQLDMTKSSKSDHSVFLLSDYNSEPEDRSLNYGGAQQACAKKNARLVKITDERSFIKFQREIGKYTSHKYWIGASFRNGNWTWDGGEVLDFTKWNLGSPKSNTTGKCIASSRLGWEDFDCNQTVLHFICETATPHLLQLSEERPVVFKGKTLKVYCTADGFPVPNVTWYQNITLIANSSSSRVSQVIGKGRSLLVINAIEADDAKKYHCKASNTINGNRHTVEGFASVKVIDKDTDRKEIKEWRLEKHEELRVCRTVEADLSPVKTTKVFTYPGWVVPMVVILTLLVCGLLLGVVVLIYRRISSGTTNLNSGAGKVAFSNNPETTADNAALHIK